MVFVFYPEPSFISAVVCLALLLPLPPLDQAGGMVPGKADVTAAGGGADSSAEASQEEGLGAERQLHPAGQRHQERAVGADSVCALSMVCLRWTRTMLQKTTRAHENASTFAKSVKSISWCLSKHRLKKKD